MSYLEKAVEISTAPENCVGDNWGDLINLCGEADGEIEQLQAELATYKAGNVPVTQILADNETLAIENDELKERRGSLIYCPAVTCANNKELVCSFETIHLQGCSPDADNVFACSEFTEQAKKGDE